MPGRLPIWEAWGGGEAEGSALDDTLDACIDRLLLANETLEQCLSVCPDHEAHLKPLLETALTIKKAFVIPPGIDIHAARATGSCGPNGGGHVQSDTR